MIPTTWLYLIYHRINKVFSEFIRKFLHIDIKILPRHTTLVLVCDESQQNLDIENEKSRIDRIVLPFVFHSDTSTLPLPASGEHQNLITVSSVARVAFPTALVRKYLYQSIT